jgi:hypothetical protein
MLDMDCSMFPEEKVGLINTVNQYIPNQAIMLPPTKPKTTLFCLTCRTLYTKKKEGNFAVFQFFRKKRQTTSLNFMSTFHSN